MGAFNKTPEELRGTFSKAAGLDPAEVPIEVLNAYAQWVFEHERYEPLEFFKDHPELAVLVPSEEFKEKLKGAGIQPPLQDPAAAGQPPLASQESASGVAGATQAGQPLMDPRLIPGAAPTGQAGSTTGNSTLDALVTSLFPDPEERAAFMAQAASGTTGEETQLFGPDDIVTNAFFVGQEVVQEMIDEVTAARSKSPAERRQLQRNLVAAGYLDPEQAMMGWVDASTAKAYAMLLMDANQLGRSAADVMRERMLYAGVIDKDALGELKEEVRDERKHMGDLSEAYKQAWGKAPPPGYLETVSHMNPVELGEFERQKDAWLESGVAQQDFAGLMAQVNDWVEGGGENIRRPGRQVRRGTFGSVEQTVRP